MNVASRRTWLVAPFTLPALARAQVEAFPSRPLQLLSRARFHHHGADDGRSCASGADAEARGSSPRWAPLRGQGLRAAAERRIPSAAWGGSAEAIWTMRHPDLFLASARAIRRRRAELIE